MSTVESVGATLLANSNAPMKAGLCPIRLDDVAKRASSDFMTLFSMSN